MSAAIGFFAVISIGILFFVAVGAFAAVAIHKQLREIQINTARTAANGLQSLKDAKKI